MRFRCIFYRFFGRFSNVFAIVRGTFFDRRCALARKLCSAFRPTAGSVFSMSGVCRCARSAAKNITKSDRKSFENPSQNVDKTIVKIDRFFIEKSMKNRRGNDPWRTTFGELHKMLVPDPSGSVLGPILGLPGSLCRRPGVPRASQERPGEGPKRPGRIPEVPRIIPISARGPPGVIFIDFESIWP